MVCKQSANGKDKIEKHVPGGQLGVGVNQWRANLAVVSVVSIEFDLVYCNSQLNADGIDAVLPFLFSCPFKVNMIRAVRFLDVFVGSVYGLCKSGGHGEVSETAATTTENGWCSIVLSGIEGDLLQIMNNRVFICLSRGTIKYPDACNHSNGYDGGSQYELKELLCAHDSLPRLHSAYAVLPAQSLLCFSFRQSVGNFIIPAHAHKRRN